jgi:excisionase family DNA binding protein
VCSLGFFHELRTRRASPYIAAQLSPALRGRVANPGDPKKVNFWGYLVLKNPLVVAQPVPRLLTVPQAAAYLACTVPAVRALQWSRSVPFLRIGKRVVFDRGDLDRYVDAQKVL